MIKKLSTEERLKKHLPIETWALPEKGWKWEVYKKYQKPEKEATNPYARWFCKVTSPFVPSGESGDVYIKDIKGVGAKKLKKVL